MKRRKFYQQQQQQFFNKLEINTKQVTQPHLAYAILGGGLSRQSNQSRNINIFNCIYISDRTVIFYNVNII